MTSDDLAALTVELVAQADGIIHGILRLSRSAMIGYWVASKCRLDRWFGALGTQQQRERAEHLGPTHREFQAQQTVLEILRCEPLTRVWAALISAHDRHHHRLEAGPVARSVYSGHMEVRHRALKFIEQMATVDESKGRELNSVRRCTERWSDTLLAALGDCTLVHEFAVDRRRMQSMQRGRSPQRMASSRIEDLQYWHALVQSFRAIVPHERPSPSSRQLNREIGTSILACLPGDWPLIDRRWQTAWHARIGFALDDASGMVADALANAAPEANGET